MTLLFLAFSTLTAFSQSLSGIYTIGSDSDDYSSFKAALHDLHLYGVSGPTTFKVRDGVYSETDTIRNIKNSSNYNKITFESLHGDDSEVVLEWDSRATGNWNLRLENTGFITFKNITFRQLYDEAKNNVLLLNCHDIQFDQCTFEGSELVGDGSLLSGTVDSNVTVSNCNFAYARRGIELKGTEKKVAKNISIIGNKLTTQTIGIMLSEAQNVLVEKNQINNLTGTPYTGLLLRDAYSFKILGNQFNTRAHTSNSRAVYLQNVTADTSSMALVANNILNTNALGGKDVSALKLYATTNTTIAHNTIRLSSDHTQHSVVGFDSDDSLMTNTTFYNNIVSNEGAGYAAKNFNFTTSQLHSDYNVWYAHSGKISSSLLSLTELKAMQRETHSYFGSPQFARADSLYPNCMEMDSNAFPLAAVSTDFFGNKRNTTVPDIGAIERLRLPEVNLGNDTTHCESLELIAQSTGLQHRWSTEEFGTQISVNHSGKYWVEATNGDGKASDTIHVQIISNPDFIVDAIEDPSLNGSCYILKTSIGATSSSTYSWSDQAGILSSQATVAVCPDAFPATYCVEVLNAQGCSKKDSITIYHNTEEESSLTSNISSITVSKGATESDSAMAHKPKKTGSNSSALVNLYPNPSSEKVFVQLSSAEELLELKLTDLAGNQLAVKSQKVVGKGLHELSINHLAVGSYILIVETLHNIYRLPVSKQ